MRVLELEKCCGPQHRPAEGSTEVAADAAPSTLMVHISGDVSALGAEDVEAFEKQVTAWGLMCFQRIEVHYSLEGIKCS